MENKKIILALASICFAGAVFAATDGTLGPTSQGSLVITLKKPTQVQITGLADIDFGQVIEDPDPFPLEGNSDACVYSPQATHNGYQVRPSVDIPGSTTALTIKNGGSSIPYSVYWKIGAGPGGGDLLSPGVYSTNSYVGSPTINCGGVKNANVRVEITRTNYDLGTLAGTYTGTLYLTVRPRNIP